MIDLLVGENVADHHAGARHDALLEGPRARVTR
jgi:hypothetical protein